jgi:hypothetical protein
MLHGRPIDRAARIAPVVRRAEEEPRWMGGAAEIDVDPIGTFGAHPDVERMVGGGKADVERVLTP